ncbi:hypothetical protein VDF76_20805 [Xanthomonas campestris pv. raphani]|uniref:hypothetical protein n=1 Tax=Xanthomonas campestris TaxID=339 RepID=UPI002B229779|nr:hypothetical protein [Xanthomonas campestris]MEA9749380.1 hypothetical protein [Xanthomonas campestris pv. raphani]
MEQQQFPREIDAKLIKAIYGREVDAAEVPHALASLLQVITEDGTTSLSEIPCEHVDAFGNFSGLMTVFAHKGRQSSGGDDWLEYLRWRLALSEDGLSPEDVPDDTESTWFHNRAVRSSR